MDWVEPAILETIESIGAKRSSVGARSGVARLKHATDLVEDLTLAVRDNASAERASHLASALNRLEPVQRQILCRTINEEIRHVGGAAFEAEMDLVCECMQPSCFEAVRASRTQYENVRRFPIRFLVKPGHFDRESERVVEDHDRLLVIEKFGPGAEVVILRDPRLAPTPNRQTKDLGHERVPHDNRTAR